MSTPQAATAAPFKRADKVKLLSGTRVWTVFQMDQPASGSPWWTVHIVSDSGDGLLIRDAIGSDLLTAAT